MEISMNIKKKILGITIAPVITLGLISMFLTTTMVRSAMLEEIEDERVIIRTKLEKPSKIKGLALI